MPSDDFLRGWRGESLPEHLKDNGDLFGKLVSIGLLVALLFTALAFGAVEPWSIAIFSAWVVILALLWMVKSLFDRQIKVAFPATTWPILVFVAYAVLQSISWVNSEGRRFAISMDVEATRLALGVLIVLFVCFLIFSNFFTNRQRLFWLRSFLIVFGLALAIFGLVQKFTWNGRYYWFIEPSLPPMSPFGSFVNRNHFAGYLEMIVPIPVAMILIRAVAGELSIFYGFSAVMMSVAIFLSLSRGGMVSLIAGLIFVLAFGLKPLIERMRGFGKAGWGIVILPRIGAVVLILLTIGFGVLWTGADEVMDRARSIEVMSGVGGNEEGSRAFFRSRGWIWRDTVSMIRANWLTGVGLGAFETAYPIYTASDGSVLVRHAHNDYLQVVADCGVVGAVIALWFIIAVFWDFARAMRHRDEEMIGMALGCGGGLVAMLVHSLFDFNLQLPSNALLFLGLTAVVSNIGAAASSKKVGSALGVKRDIELAS